MEEKELHAYLENCKNQNEANRVNVGRIDTALSEAFTGIIKNCTNEAKVLSTGLWTLDGELSCLRTGELCMVSGCVGVGKTSFALNVSCNMAEKGNAVAIFSLSETREQVARRLLTIEGCVSLKNLGPGSLKDEDWNRLHLAEKSLREMDIRLYDDKLTAEDIISECKMVKHPQLIVIDGLSAYYSENGDDIRKNDEFLHMLKNFAEDQNVLILCTCDLCYDVHERPDQCPRVKDLPVSRRGLSFVDVLLFLYFRDTYVNTDGSEPRNMYCRIDKNVYGDPASLVLEWLPQFTTFRDMIR